MCVHLFCVFSDNEQVNIMNNQLITKLSKYCINFKAELKKQKYKIGTIPIEILDTKQTELFSSLDKNALV